MNSCKSYEILHVSYYFTRKDGYIGKFKAKCIKDRGLPGKEPKLIKDLKRCTLSKYGYSSKIKSAKLRREFLTEAVKDLGYNIVIKKLNAVKILNKNTNPAISKIFDLDMKWIQKNFNIKLNYFLL